MAIFINNQQLESFFFSGGECQVRVNVHDIGQTTHILAYITSSDDVMSLLLAVDAIRRVNPGTMIKLKIPYFPYARQDRVCYPGEALSLKVMADLINQLQCDELVIVDPHSDVCPALLNKCKFVTMSDIVMNSELYQIILEKKLALVSPDAGAEKKIKSVYNSFLNKGQMVSVFCSSKIRDPKTGHILASEIKEDVEGRDLMIMDDICDGGATFIELAKVLKSKGAHNIYLYVTHGIFSKGMTELKKYFTHIYTYHSSLCKAELDSTFITVLQKNLEHHHVY